MVSNSRSIQSSVLLQNILPNEELLVWYGESTEVFFGIPVFGCCRDTCKGRPIRFFRSLQEFLWRLFKGGYSRVNIVLNYFAGYLFCTVISY